MFSARRHTSAALLAADAVHRHTSLTSTHHSKLWVRSDNSTLLYIARQLHGMQLLGQLRHRRKELGDAEIVKNRQMHKMRAPKIQGRVFLRLPKRRRQLIYPISIYIQGFLMSGGKPVSRRLQSGWQHRSRTICSRPWRQQPHKANGPAAGTRCSDGDIIPAAVPCSQHGAIPLRPYWLPMRYTAIPASPAPITRSFGSAVITAPFFTSRDSCTACNYWER